MSLLRGIAYQQWGWECSSDVLYFPILGQDVIVLNSAQAAVDLLEKRGANYSDRPRCWLLEFMGWRHTLTCLRWGRRSGMHRRVLQWAFPKSALAPLRPLQARCSTDSERSRSRTPRSATHGGSRGTGVGPSAGSTTRRSPPSPPWVGLEGRGAHKEPGEEGEAQALLVCMLLDQREARCDAGQPEEMAIEDVEGAAGAVYAGAVYAAGQDTTWSTLMVLVLRMVLHSGVQRNTHKPRSTPSSARPPARLPTFADRPHLPCFERLLHGTLRWWPISPMGVPHRGRPRRGTWSCRRRVEGGRFDTVEGR